MTQGTKVHAHVRWMIRRDMPQVCRIESESFPHPWREEDFINCMRQRSRIGMVATVEDEVVGYMIYELHKHRLHVLNFAVDQAFRRMSVGSQMIRKLTDKLSDNGRTRIMLEVSEKNLEAQLFFKSQGFKAISILKDFFVDCEVPEDAYLFSFRHLPSDFAESRDGIHVSMKG